MSQEEGVVTPEDVAVLQGMFKPGRAIPANQLYGALSKLKGERREPLAHQTALGHALRRAGWMRHRSRKRRGGVQEEVASWIIPGAPPQTEDDDNVYATLIALGGGVYKDSQIWAKYQELTRANGWRWTLSEPELNRWLTRHHFLKLPGKTRFVPPERLKDMA